jgi:hypothetical protein
LPVRRKDPSEEAFKFARVEGEDRGNKNASFIARDLSRFDQQAQPGTFDFITTYDAVHDQASPEMPCAAFGSRWLTTGSTWAGHQSLERRPTQSGAPAQPLLYTISCLHCITVSLAQGGDDLGAMWGKEMAMQYFQEAGFDSVQVHELAHDIQNCYYVCRP